MICSVRENITLIFFSEQQDKIVQCRERQRVIREHKYILLEFTEAKKMSRVRLMSHEAYRLKKKKRDT